MKKPPKDTDKSAGDSAGDRLRSSKPPEVGHGGAEANQDSIADPAPSRKGVSAPTDPKTGYKAPPRKGRWPKGKSGNPTGRKKGSKNKRTVIIGMMEAKLGRKIPDPNKLTRYEGMILKAIQKALGGDIRSFSVVLAEYRKAIEAAGPSVTTPTTEEDQQAYQTLYEKLRREIEHEIGDALRVQIRAEILTEMKKGR